MFWRERNEAIGERGKESVPAMTRICSAGTGGVGDEAVRRENGKGCSTSQCGTDIATKAVNRQCVTVMVGLG